VGDKPDERRWRGDGCRTRHGPTLHQVNLMGHADDDMGGDRLRTSGVYRFGERL
jgi:hypothetical protein